MIRGSLVLSVALLLAPIAGFEATQASGDPALLQGDRRVIGTVEDVKSDQIQVNTGEVQPRFIPLKQAKEKGLPVIKKGDRIEITVNDQNLIVDYHVVDASGHPERGTHHRIVKGRIAQPLVIGHDRAVIRTEQGAEEGYEIRS